MKAEAMQDRASHPAIADILLLRGSAPTYTLVQKHILSPPTVSPRLTQSATVDAAAAATARAEAWTRSLLKAAAKAGRPPQGTFSCASAFGNTFPTPLNLQEAVFA